MVREDMAVTEVTEQDAEDRTEWRRGKLFTNPNRDNNPNCNHEPIPNHNPNPNPNH